MQKIVRTAYAAELNQRFLRRLPFVARKYTTLNEKLGILPTAVVPTGEYPIVNYVAVGNQGHTFGMDGSGVAELKVKQHRATDACPFGLTPLVLRPITNDIAPARRERYALRKEIKIGDAWYVAYYLRRLESVSQDILAEIRTTVDGVVTSTPFVPDASCLDPQPSAIDFDNANLVLGKSIAYITEIPFTLDADDIQEYLNACILLFGNESKAIISDLALCSGYDQKVTVTSVNGGGTFQFTEAVSVQVFTFVSCFYPTPYLTQGVDTTLGLMCDNPLFALDGAVG